MDGVIDLSGVSRVNELPPPAAPGAGYAFETETWDSKLYVLSAVTAGIRANWVSAIRRTAGLPEPSNIGNDDVFSIGKSLPLIGRQDSTDTSESSLTPTTPMTPLTPMTPRSQMFSSDEEYRTASEGGRRDSIDWGDISQLPPSPILNRTPISRVKEKVRLRLGSHNHVGLLPSPQSDEPPQSDIDEIDSIQEVPIKECADLYQELKENAKNEQSQIIPKQTYISIDKQSIEIEDLRKQLKIAMNDVAAAEKDLNRLRKIKAESVLRENKIEELVLTLQKTEDELQRRSRDTENLESLQQIYNQDKNMWELKLSETEKFLKESKKHCELLTKQLTSGQETIMKIQHELSLLNEKLIRKVEENTELHLKVRDLEISLGEQTPFKVKRRSINSLSELANIDLEINLESLAQDKLIEEYQELRERFLKAIQEIKAMKIELRESHGLYDELELTNQSIRKEMEHKEKREKSQIALMAERIQDLTSKLTASDKQVRSLKHRLQKSESRDKRRSLSLKGNESFSLGREVEDKLVELESKISILESNKSDAPFLNTPSKHQSPVKDNDRSKELTLEEKKLKRIAARLRRKSLDSATGSEPMKMLIRLSSLETKVCSALHERGELANSLESISQATSESPFSNESPDESTIFSNSHKHLVDRLQSLENIVIHSRNKVNQCLCQITNLRSSRLRRSPSPSLDKSHSMRSIEKSLVDISKTLQDCFDKCIVECEQEDSGKINEDIKMAVEELEGQFRTKFLEISKKKLALLETGRLDHQKNLELCAEKLAYEAFMINKIHEAIGTKASSLFSKLIASEIDETSKLIDDLQIKIDEPNSDRNEGSHKTLKDSLAQILTRRIEYSSAFTDNVKVGEFIARKSDFDSLKQMHKRLTLAFEKFKTDKVVELAAAGVEGTSLETAAGSALCAAAAAREAARALRRAAQPSIEGPLVPCHGDLEPWWHAAHLHLQTEARNVTSELASRCLTRPRRAADDGQRSLCQLADAIAYKSLIDARMAAFEDANKSVDNSSLSEAKITNNNEESTPSFKAGDYIEQDDYVNLFRQFSKECVTFAKNEQSHTEADLEHINESLQAIEDLVKGICKDSEIEMEIIDGDNSIEKSLYLVIINKCRWLKSRVEAMAKLPCKSCQRLQESLDRIKAEHCRSEAAFQQQASSLTAARRARSQLQAQHEHERTQRERERTQYDKERIQHENERTQLREHARRLERRLSTLDAEYSQQLENLKTAYRDTLVTDLAGDSLRARYQAEIEQLRALCEKGLLAMESSHRRILQEMEDKHKTEREQLRMDKEQALAEETRATLAALDAMRKAHESEVRREVDKFKSDFLGRLAPPRSPHPDRPDHPSVHQQEMEEIRREILSLSEKYSIKCVESVSLEEKLNGATQQLQQAKQQILQLDARNKQLRAHLMAEAKELKNLDCSTLAHVIDESPLKINRPSQVSLEPAMSAVRKTKIQFAKTESTRNLQLSPVQN